MDEGHLVLNMNKDVYMQLGLEGRPSKFCQKRRSRYVVNVDLCSEHFRPGKKRYHRVEWCFTDRLNLEFDFFVSWVPFGNKLDSFLILSECSIFLFVFDSFMSKVHICTVI